MIKYFAFSALLLVFVVLLRPDLFWKMSSDSEEITEKTKTDDKAFSESRKPSLLVKNSDKKSEIRDGYTEYDDGYSDRDFSAIKEPEDIFKSKEESFKQSTGGLWEVFLKLRFDITYDHATDNVAMRPIFTPEIRTYNNKIIEMDGYIIPNDIVHGAVGERGNGTMFMLSAFPTATCFFCKGAGPESVMEVYPKKPIPYSKNVVKIKGRLELNEYDYMKMAYILKNAEIVY